MAEEREPSCTPVYYTGTERVRHHSDPSSDATSHPPVSYAEDYSTFDIVKATQYGVYDRCREIIESGYDVNQPDSENVTLLHWASINNRREIVKYYISKGAVIDAVGGELQSTPLHWATRQGHLSMVVLLMQHGADPSLIDGEGCSCIHLAAQFGHTAIVAYLVAKGQNVNLTDRNGMTPLMWSCYRITTNDPTRLLITLGASLTMLDSHHRNSPLHWAVYARNTNAVSLLLKAGADIEQKNAQGDTALAMAQKLKVHWVAKRLEEAEKEQVQRTHCVAIYRDKKLRYGCMMGSPFLVFYLIGACLESRESYLVKAGLILALGIGVSVAGRLLFDDRILNILPISVYLSTKFWMYVTWFTWFQPYVGDLQRTLGFLICSAFLFYSFVKAWKSDPGVISSNQEQKYRTIIELAERDGFDPTWFCSTCLVRRPLRSKHCAVCDRCIARFDHHCPWVGNCVGVGNHKHFVCYLIFLLIMICWCLHGCYMFWKGHLFSNSLPLYSFIWHSFFVSGWVGWISLNAALHGIWVSCLLLCQLYQNLFCMSICMFCLLPSLFGSGGNMYDDASKTIQLLYEMCRMIRSQVQQTSQVIWLSMTTNERMNCTRYPHFKKDKNGIYHSPFYRGVFQNLVDFCEWRCCGLLKTDSRDWKQLFEISDEEEDATLLHSGQHYI